MERAEVVLHIAEGSVFLSENEVVSETMTSNAFGLMRAFLSALILVSGLSCVAQEDPVQVRVHFLDAVGSPPENLDLVEVRVLQGDTEVIPTFSSSLRERPGVEGSGLPDENGNGRPELVVDIPTGENVEIELYGFDATFNAEGAPESLTLSYVGRSGQLWLEPGERRYIDIGFYKIGEANALDRFDDHATPRAFHTATRLDDGRILISGGFDRTAAVDCPAEAPAGSSCHELTATRSAQIYDPATARYWPVTMLEGRGGHSATLLSDGRVLLAGGSNSLTLAFLPASAGAGVMFFSADAHASFEIFDPELGREAEDAARDGDPGRGMFVGGPGDTSVVGALNVGRVLHGAAVEGGQVVLAGGLGRDASMTFELFDENKAGGYGVYSADGNIFDAPHEYPAVTVLDGEVWVIGGSIASSNEHIAEVIEISSAGDASVSNAVDAGFPTGPSMQDRPGFGLVGPRVMEEDGVALVVGWVGPQCDPADPNTPVFEADSFVGCAASDRGFTINDGVAQSANDTGYAFGTLTRLVDGKVVGAGGLDSSDYATSPDTLLYRDIPSGGATASSLALLRPRAFHAAAPLFDTAIFISGGLRVTGDGSMLTFIDTDEAHVFDPSGFRTVVEAPPTTEED